MGKKASSKDLLRLARLKGYKNGQPLLFGSSRSTSLFREKRCVKRDEIINRTMKTGRSKLYSITGVERSLTVHSLQWTLHCSHLIKLNTVSLVALQGNSNVLSSPNADRAMTLYKKISCSVEMMLFYRII